MSQARSVGLALLVVVPLLGALLHQQGHTTTRPRSSEPSAAPGNAPLAHASEAAVPQPTAESTVGGGLIVVDLVDPGHPTIVGSVPEPRFPLGVAVAGQHAYVAVGRDGVYVVDVADPSVPRGLGFRATVGMARSVAALGHSLYVAAGFDGVRILDLADPAQPVEVGSYPLPTGARTVA